MKRILWSVPLTAVLLVSLILVFAPSALAADSNRHHPDNAGAVYTMTNDPAGNEVVVFERTGDGTLTEVASIPTGGTGFGDGTNPDPLVSQGSLVLSDNGKWLLAVNAGSDEITVFRVKSQGIEMTDKIGSGGNTPTSITIAFNRVYVLNADPDGGNPNITGFILGPKGKLHPIPNSTRALAGGGYSQVGFNNLGSKLVITGRGQDELVVFEMRLLVPAATPVITPSSGAAPFGFIFDKLGRLLVVEVNGGNGAVTSYKVKFNGSLEVISPSVASGQVAACWIAGNNRGYVYTTNPGSNSISAYKENRRGKVKLLDATAATGIATLDEGISNNGKYLYALDPGMGGIQAYQIGKDGSLISLGFTPGAGLGIYAQGLAVK